jgi:hypothetical protein
MQKTAPFGSDKKKATVNFWLGNFRKYGVAGLINDNKLFSSAKTSAKERRTLAEVTPYLAALDPQSGVLMGAAKLAVLRNQFADMRDRLERDRNFTKEDLLVRVFNQCLTDV